MCDDDTNALPVIAGAVKSAFMARNIRTEVKCFRSGKRLLEALKTEHFHLVLLDIDMPEMDGIETGKQIREKHDDVRIVYVSEAESRVFESFQVQPLGFVRKSNFLNDITAVVQVYIKNAMQKEEGDMLEFTTRTSLLRLKKSAVLYIEGSRNYQVIHMNEDGAKTEEVKMTMEKLEEMLAPKGFIRIHKGFLVNYQYIRRIHTSVVELKDGTELPVGRSKMPEVKAKYLSLLGD